MPILDVARPHKHGSGNTTFQLQPAIVIDEVAYRLLRWVVLFAKAKTEKHPTLLEKAACIAGAACSGKINLSEESQRDGWHTAEDESGYCYAHFQESDARTI